MPEEREYLTYEETAEALGMSRASVYNYVNDLKIKTYKFKRAKYTYIARGDLARIREALEKPWILGEKKEPAGV